MTLGIAIFMGILSAVSLLIVLARINLRKFLGYPVLLDVLGTVFFAIALAGTITGIMIAIIAGLVLSVAVWGLRKVMGWKVYKRGQGWIYYPPTGFFKLNEPRTINHK